MISGDRVRVKATSQLRQKYPELSNAIGVVSSTMHTKGGALVHVRFERPVNLVAMNVLASEFEEVDRLEPRLRVV